MLVYAVWAVVYMGLWLDAYPYSRLNRQASSKRVTGSNKVVLDLANAINHNGGEEVASTLTDSTLKKRIRHDIDGKNCHPGNCFPKAKRNDAAPRDITA
jgi:hypothetical protein